MLVAVGKSTYSQAECLTNLKTLIDCQREREWLRQNRKKESDPNAHDEEVRAIMCRTAWKSLDALIPEAVQKTNTLNYITVGNSRQYHHIGGLSPAQLVLKLYARPEAVRQLTLEECLLLLRTVGSVPGAVLAVRGTIFTTATRRVLLEKLSEDPGIKSKDEHYCQFPCVALSALLHGITLRELKALPDTILRLLPDEKNNSFTTGKYGSRFGPTKFRPFIDCNYVRYPVQLAMAQAQAIWRAIYVTRLTVFNTDKAESIQDFFECFLTVDSVAILQQATLLALLQSAKFKQAKPALSWPVRRALIRRLVTSELDDSAFNDCLVLYKQASYQELSELDEYQLELYFNTMPMPKLSDKGEVRYRLQAVETDVPTAMELSILAWVSRPGTHEQPERFVSALENIPELAFLLLPPSCCRALLAKPEIKAVRHWSPAKLNHLLKIIAQSSWPIKYREAFKPIFSDLRVATITRQTEDALFYYPDPRFRASLIANGPVSLYQFSYWLNREYPLNPELAPALAIINATQLQLLAALVGRTPLKGKVLTASVLTLMPEEKRETILLQLATLGLSKLSAAAAVLLLRWLGDLSSAKREIYDIAVLSSLCSKIEAPDVLKVPDCVLIDFFNRCTIKSFIKEHGRTVPFYTGFKQLLLPIAFAYLPSQSRGVYLDEQILKSKSLDEKHYNLSTIIKNFITWLGSMRELDRVTIGVAYMVVLSNYCLRNELHDSLRPLLIIFNSQKPTFAQLEYWFRDFGSDHPVLLQFRENLLTYAEHLAADTCLYDRNRLLSEDSRKVAVKTLQCW